MRLSPDKVERVGKFKGERPIAIFRDTVCAWKKLRSSIRFLQLDSKGMFSQEKSSHKLKPEFKGNFFHKILPDASAIVCYENTVVRITPEMKI